MKCIWHVNSSLLNQNWFTKLKEHDIAVICILLPSDSRIVQAITFIDIIDPSSSTPQLLIGDLGT